jgi:hypothetical protein
MCRAGIAALAITALAGCTTDNATADRGVDVPDIDAPDTDTGGTASLDIEDVVDNPTAYAGRTVTLDGEVEETFSPGRAFSMTGGGVIAENEIIVLSKGQQVMPVEEGQMVRATGTVRAYAADTRSQLETDLGWTFESNLEAELQQAKAVLIAENITPAQR